MKKFSIVLAAVLLSALMGYTQKITPNKVPSAVKEAFAKKFPAATDVKYEMEKKDYEINFKEKGVGMSANFDATGKWLETETEINVSDLPREVATSAADKYPGFKITEVAKTETPEKGMIYELEFRTDKEAWEIQFLPDGKVVKRTPLK